MYCVMHRTQDVLISKKSCETGHMVRDIQSFNTTVDRFRLSPSLSGIIVVRQGQNEVEIKTQTKAERSEEGKEGDTQRDRDRKRKTETARNTDKERERES